MIKKKKSYSGRVLFFLSLFSVVIATLEGILFYAKHENIFWRILLIIQNDITLFGFGAKIALEDAFSFMKENPSVFRTVLGYAYGVAVYAAPYCTLVVAYRVLEYMFRFVLLFRPGKGKERVIIFGYNKTVESMLERDETKTMKSRCVHIVSAEEIPAEKRYLLRKAGYVLHIFDCITASKEELFEFLKKIAVEKATDIVLLEEDAVENFSLLQMFPLERTEKGISEISLHEDVKVFCRCEDEDVSRLIEDYYNGFDKEEAGYDLELFSLPELQIREMYTKYPLYSYYEGREEKLLDWNINLLIVGFGKLGQQALLQAMNLGVVHKDNRIRIDVIDYNVEEKVEIFLNRFSKQTYEMEENHFRLKSELADGTLDVYFYNMNVHYRRFHELLKQQKGDAFYHYAVVSMKDASAALHCAMELKRALDSAGRNNVPVVLQMEKDKRLALYIAENHTQFSDVVIMSRKEEVLSLDLFVNRGLDLAAKEFHYFYSTIKIIEQNYSSVNKEILDAEAVWNKLKLFRRESSRAVACHHKGKEMIAERLAKEAGKSLDCYLDTIFGKNGTLFVYDGTAWRLESTEEAFIEALKADKFAYEFAAMEHRRWCYFMISKGWKYGERKDRARMNPCIVPQRMLLENQADMCKYDFMPLMMIYLYKKNTRDA